MEDVNLTFRLIMVFVGVAGVLVGAQLLVDSAVDIAESFDISSYIIGATIVAIGTSLPELASSVAAALKGKHGIAIGNVIGSNIINILLVLGIASSIFTIRIADIQDGSLILNLTLPLLIVISIIMTLFIKLRMKKWQGVVLLTLYAIFMLLFFI
jgi:cation:H+ antiporter